VVGQISQSQNQVKHNLHAKPMLQMAPLPETMFALVIHSTDRAPTVERVPTPQPFHGSAIVKILSAGIISYMRDIYNGKRNYPFPTPLIAGTSAVGHVVAVGPDAVKMRPGDLVFVDCTIRARDSDDIFLAAISQGFGEGSAKLMKDVWRDWTYAEYCRTPLECLTLLDENRLIGDLGYSFGQIMYSSTLLVPYGGLRDINVQAGETVIIAPATGPYGGAAVLVALAMGAKVIGKLQESLDFAKPTDCLAMVAIRTSLRRWRKWWHNLSA
jgi:NADPH:quinone reductase-like Zn-dependent oxidoreductase